MKQIKQAFYAVFLMALVVVPAVAGAQWGRGLKNASSSQLPGDSIYNIIARIMDWLLGILGFIGIIGFVIAGILYLTAAGDEEQLKTAKRAMLYSIVGVIVALIGFVIVKAVQGLLTAGGTATF